MGGESTVTHTEKTMHLSAFTTVLPHFILLLSPLLKYPTVGAFFQNRFVSKSCFP